MKPLSEGRLSRLRRGLTVCFGLLLLWWLATLSNIPSFLLPSPIAVAKALWYGRDYLAYHSLVTASEIVSGLTIGVLLGVLLALSMIFSPRFTTLADAAATGPARPIPVICIGSTTGAVVRFWDERQSGHGGAGHFFSGRLCLL